MSSPSISAASRLSYSERSFLSSSISMSFWPPVEGLAILSCHNERTNEPRQPRALTGPEAVGRTPPGANTWQRGWQRVSRGSREPRRARDAGGRRAPARVQAPSPRPQMRTLMPIAAHAQPQAGAGAELAEATRQRGGHSSLQNAMPLPFLAAKGTKGARFACLAALSNSLYYPRGTPTKTTGDPVRSTTIPPADAAPQTLALLSLCPRQLWPPSAQRRSSCNRETRQGSCIQPPPLSTCRFRCHRRC